MLFILMMAAAGASQTGCAEATADSAASSDDCECGEFGEVARHAPTLAPSCYSAGD